MVVDWFWCASARPALKRVLPTPVLDPQMATDGAANGSVFSLPMRVDDGVDGVDDDVDALRMNLSAVRRRAEEGFFICFLITIEFYLQEIALNR